MGNKNIEFSNPLIGDRILVIHNLPHKLEFRTFIDAGGGQNQLHYHSNLNEKFRVIKGELNVIINHEEKVLKAGEEFLILPYTNHMFYNTSKEQVVFDVEIINPNEMITGLQIMYGLVNDQKTNNSGIPKNILHTAIAVNMMDAFSHKLPYWVQKIGIATLANLGKTLGIEKGLIEKYCAE